jgi:RES domain-containing protein
LIHDPELLERLSAFEPIIFDSECFRATRRLLDPLAPSMAGGRWMVPGYKSVLYLSCSSDGALAEVSYHLAQQTPLPTKTILLHRVQLSTKKTLRLMRPDLEGLGMDWGQYIETDYSLSQEIGAAVAFLECDGLVVPSARWLCDNMIVFTDNEGPQTRIAVIGDAEEIDWVAWARQNGLLK